VELLEVDRRQDHDEFLCQVTVHQCVPVDESLEVVFGGLHEDDTLMQHKNLSPPQITHLQELCRKTTYFKFQ